MAIAPPVWVGERCTCMYVCMRREGGKVRVSELLSTGAGGNKKSLSLQRARYAIYMTEYKQCWIPSRQRPHSHPRYRYRTAPPLAVANRAVPSTNNFASRIGKQSPNDGMINAMNVCAWRYRAGANRRRSTLTPFGFLLSLTARCENCGAAALC